MSKAKMSRILDRVAVASQVDSQLRAWEQDRIQESSERDTSEQPLHHQPALEPMEVEEAHQQQFGVQSRLALLWERQEYLQKVLDAMEVAEPVTSCVDATHSSLPMKRIVHADDDSNEEDAVLVYSWRSVILESNSQLAWRFNCTRLDNCLGEKWKT